MLQAATLQYNLANKVEIMNFVFSTASNIMLSLFTKKFLGRLKKNKFLIFSLFFVAFLGRLTNVASLFVHYTGECCTISKYLRM
jgi:hypothetical protein